MSLRDKVAQLIIVPIYGEPANTRSAEFRKYQHLIRDLHVGGVIVTGHSLNGGVRNAEPYAMAALLNRLQKLARTPLFVAADFERGASMRVNSTTAWPYSMAFTAAEDLEAVTEEGADTAHGRYAKPVEHDCNRDLQNRVRPEEGAEQQTQIGRRQAELLLELGRRDRDVHPVEIIDENAGAE